jgi:hypothetical protein
MRHRVIGGWNGIYFVEHAASFFRMETLCYLLPANVDGVGRVTAEDTATLEPEPTQHSKPTFVWVYIAGTFGYI